MAGEEHSTTARPGGGWLWWALGVLLLVLLIGGVWAFLNARFPAGVEAAPQSSADAAGFAVDACVNGLDDPQVVPCEDRHTWKVIHVGTADDALAPTALANTARDLWAALLTQCAEPYQAATEQPLDTATGRTEAGDQVLGLIPTQRSWANGDRALVCGIAEDYTPPTPTPTPTDSSTPSGTPTPGPEASDG